MKDEFAEINVIPLVDIMLVLIVIVLITANFVITGALPVRPPKSETEEVTLSDTVLLGMTAEGEIYYNKRPIASEELEARLGEVDTARPVLISADRDLTLQPFMTLVDRLKKLGFTKFSIQTER